MGTTINNVLTPVVKALAVPVFDHRGVITAAWPQSVPLIRRARGPRWCRS